MAVGRKLGIRLWIMLRVEIDYDSAVADGGWKQMKKTLTICECLGAGGEVCDIKT